MWLHPPLSSKSVAKIIRDILKSNVEEIFLLATQTDGTATYASSIRPRAAQAKGDVFGRLASELRLSGIAVHGWLCVNLLSNASAETEKGHSALNRFGEQVIDRPPLTLKRWACASDPEHRRVACSLARELLAMHELDGIHLDYIRYPNRRIMPHIARRFSAAELSELRTKNDCCYCAECLRRFGRANARAARKSNFHASRAWHEWRSNNVAITVRQIKASVRGKKLSAAPFATHSIAREYVSQDVSKFGKYLDFIAPMIYNTYYLKPVEWVERAVKENKKVFRGPVLAGIGPLKFLSASELGRAIEAAEAGGADGVSIFSYAQMTKEKWKAIE